MVDSSGVSPWILSSKPRPWATARLFCFPYAGGGASVFRTWSNDLPDTVEVCPVQLPGRENRLKETAFTSMLPLIESVANGLLPWLDRPFAFFGHSMGAFVAFELARALRGTHGLSPAHLFVSGCRAPHLPDPDPPIHALPDPEFVEELRRMQGTPEQVLQHPELLRLIVSLMRADMKLVETYAFTPGDPLDCAVTAVGGTDDPQAGRAAIDAWRPYTRGTFRSHILPGDHFFVRTERAQILRLIADDLSLSLT
jgi:medium-chain acyl-[acyl-carrier-protein] hydrolase